jgi:aldehyde dehydrogenase (NAD+)
VLKPAELTPLTALWLGQAALDAGLPPGVLNILPGYGHDAGAALVSHRGIDKISFTGSPVTGRSIMKAAAENITRLTLELGGKSPSVVFDDADLDAAARAITSGAFFNAGQVCSAATRVIVQDTVYDAFVERLSQRAAALRSGDPQASETVLGPVISGKQMERVLGYIDSGKAEGARVTAGGGRMNKPGYFVDPTIFADVSTDMQIWREEIFGPVLAVARFSREEDAVELANGTDYSLAAAVWTRDIDRVTRMTRAINAGTVWVNTYGPTDARLPWGGMGGQSGIGRDLGRSAIDNYTEQKTVWIRQGAAV